MNVHAEGMLPVASLIAAIVIECLLDAAAQVRAGFPISGILEFVNIGDVVARLDIHVILGPRDRLDFTLPDNADDDFHHLLETRSGAAADIEDLTAAGRRDGGEEQYVPQA